MRLAIRLNVLDYNRMFSVVPVVTMVIIILLVLVAIYLVLLPFLTIYRVIKNGRLSNNARIAWVIGTFLTGPLAGIIYFIWRGSSKFVRIFHGLLLAFLVFALLGNSPFIKNFVDQVRARAGVPSPKSSDGTVLGERINHYREIQAKAKQGEAKTTLFGLYTSQRAFHAEWNRYTSDIKKLNEPTSEYRGKYKFGFAAESRDVPVNEEDPSRKDSDRANLSSPNQPSEPFDELVKKYCPECTAGKDTFKLIAIGNIDDDPTYDVWTMDERRNLVNTVDDVKH